MAKSTEGDAEPKDVSACPIDLSRPSRTGKKKAYKGVKSPTCIPSSSTHLSLVHQTSQQTSNKFPSSSRPTSPSIKMHYTKFIAIAALMFGTALAAPAAEAEAHPPKPAKPTPITNVNSNQCGNGAMPYCCDTDNSGKFNSCYANSQSALCPHFESSTIRCRLNLFLLIARLFCSF